MSGDQAVLGVGVHLEDFGIAANASSAAEFSRGEFGVEVLRGVQQWRAALRLLRDAACWSQAVLEGC
jgi:hypothetical protein